MPAEMTGRCPKCNGEFTRDGVCTVCGISCSHKFLDTPFCIKCGWMHERMLPWAQEFRAITEKARKYDESGAEALLNLLSDVFEFTDDCWGFVPKESESHSGLTRERLMSLKNRARALGLTRL